MTDICSRDFFNYQYILIKKTSSPFLPKFEPNNSTCAPGENNFLPEEQHAGSSKFFFFFRMHKRYVKKIC